jgi:methionyl-tRNA synthetase
MPPIRVLTSKPNTSSVSQQDANKYIDEQAPWKLRKAGPEGEARANTVLWTLLEAIRRIAILYQPVVPLGATRMLDQLQVPADDAARSFEVCHTRISSYCTVTVVYHTTLYCETQ